MTTDDLDAIRARLERTGYNPWKDDTFALLDEVERLRVELAHARMDRAEQADEAQRARDHLAGLDRIAKVTPCTCSAQRARATRAEATLARVRTLADSWDDVIAVERHLHGDRSARLVADAQADLLAAIEGTDS